MCVINEKNIDPVEITHDEGGWGENIEVPIVV
jgi:hypothetical protein